MSMTGKDIAKELEPSALKDIGGSRSDEWNTIVADQTIQALWKHSDPETRVKQLDATVAALIGICPRDELEGMMAAQLIAAHSAAMESYRRAMIPEQTFEGRQSPQPTSRQGAAEGDGRARPYS
jgi:hypothetical protein